MDLAASLVVRQQFLPGVRETWEHPSRFFPFWYPVYEAEDLEQMEELAAAMPVAARALNAAPRKLPRDKPRMQVRDVIMRVVDHLVWMAECSYSVSEYYRGPRRRWKIVHIHERWVERLITPDGELKGETRELLELCGEVNAWQEPVCRLRPGYEREETPISLPSSGEEFWRGRKLGEDLVGKVEAPLNPALILRRVGEIPNWQGERMLRDSLEPVYDAASRYALEYVLGRKRKPEIRRGQGDTH